MTSLVTSHEYTIALGSNLKYPIIQLDRAMERIKTQCLFTFTALSSCYQNRPYKCSAPQPDYYNIVIKGHSPLNSFKLLNALQRIEKSMGRERIHNKQNQPRTIDLDILLAGDVTLATPELTIPHPGIQDRLFVIYPMAEINNSEASLKPSPIIRKIHSIHCYSKTLQERR